MKSVSSFTPYSYLESPSDPDKMVGHSPTYFGVMTNYFLEGEKESPELVKGSLTSAAPFLVVGGGAPGLRATQRSLAEALQTPAGYSERWMRMG